MGTKKALRILAVAIFVASPAAGVSRAELFPFGRQVKDSAMSKNAKM